MRILVICSIVFMSVFAQAQSPLVWKKTYEYSGNSNILDISGCKDGSYICTGYGGADNINADLSGKGWYMKIDSTGEKIWEGNFGERDGNGESIIELSNGEYFLAGTIKHPRYYAFYSYYSWLSAKGELLKQQAYGEKVLVYREHALERADKSIIVSGYKEYGGLMRFSMERRQAIDSSRVKFPKYINIQCIAEKNGHIIAAGYYGNNDTYLYGEMLSEADENLKTLWVDTLHKKNTSSDEFFSLNLTSDGGYIVSGIRLYVNDEHSSIKHFYLKMNEQRKILWEKEFDYVFTALAMPLVVKYKDDLYVCVVTAAGKDNGDGTGNANIRLIIFNEQGETKYDYTYDSPPSEQINSITVNAKGVVVVAGTIIEVGKKQKAYAYGFLPPLGTAKVINLSVYDKHDKKPVQAVVNVRYKNGSTSQVNTNESGQVFIPVPADEACTVEVEALGYQPVKDILYASPDGVRHETKYYLVRAKPGTAMVMKNVNFERSTAKLLSGSYGELDKLVQFMTDHPEVKIELSGYTDNGGVAKANQLLSEERVETVKKYLVSRGISADRITGKGYGGKKPIAPNDTEENKSKNRRVEVKIR